MTEPPANRTRIMDLSVSAAAFLLGLPGCIGPAFGLPPADWPFPFGLHLLGDFALRTTVYLSGFSLAFGGIGVTVNLLRRSSGYPSDRAISASGTGSSEPAPAGPEEHAGLAEPFFGFLPGPVQRRLARETGYQPLLHTKVSILLSTIVGVLLAGSWEVTAETEAFPPDAAIRIGAGVYLMAESVHRYIQFSRGMPTGTLLGAVLYGAFAPLRRRT